MLEAPQKSVEELQELPVQVTWSDEGYEGSVFGGGLRKTHGEFFSIDLKGLSYPELEDNYDDYVVPAHFSGSIEYERSNGAAEKRLNAGQLNVEPQFRRNHLGERLSEALAWIAVEQGCKKIDVDFSHPASLKIFRKIFGDERIHFVHQVEGEGIMPLEISVDEALELIAEERQYVLKYGATMACSGGILEHRPKTDDEIGPGAVDGVSAWIDVDGFDASGIEPPIQTGILPGAEREDDWL